MIDVFTRILDTDAKGIAASQFDYAYATLSMTFDGAMRTIRSSRLNDIFINKE